MTWMPIPAAVSLPATSARYLPAVRSTPLALQRDETLAAGLRRVTLDQFDRALAGLTDPEADRDEAVHETRKAIKRLRAVLRMVRDEVGERVYRAENMVLRDTARRLSGVRDGAVMVEAVQKLRAHYGDYLARGAFAELEAALGERHQRRRRQVLEDAETLPSVVRTLRAARARYAAWPADASEAVGGRRVIRPGFEALGPGVGRTYRRGRKGLELARSQPSAVHFHEWRKEVKYLRHQMEVLEPLWPEVVGGLARSLDDLGEVLGEEHDLAVLLQLVAAVPTLCPHPVERSLLAAVAQHRRGELQLAGLVMGARIYAESPPRFLSRLEAYWEAWSTPAPLGMEANRGP